MCFWTPKVVINCTFWTIPPKNRLPLGSFARELLGLASVKDFSRVKMRQTHPMSELA